MSHDGRSGIRRGQMKQKGGRESEREIKRQDSAVRRADRLGKEGVSGSVGILV